ncbi:spectinomycin phosphotransferase [Allocatelliglobosispora scoriae]|uniref:Spectinomycin phosphotransferase n=1 Tax=Allocatelliglobosispora scoriae TaxID=643052 RepID=A0A841BN29_9ACTN|nr:aminoglycoside phosphotransferase family protein [Allocatelliglobosispora scoriae]MBB5868241.1 spectinomycin phosphotransferase [Allocatelliglobosispora scoriae]
MEELLRGWVRADFGLDLVSLDEVGHGADDAARLWRGRGAGGESFAVKVTTGGTPAGLLLTAHLADRGVPGILAPRTTASGACWSEREGSRLSVVRWAPGDRALAGGMTGAHWRTFGALLAAVHATGVSGGPAGLLPREDHTHDGPAAFVRTITDRLRRPSDDLLVRALAERWHAAAGELSALSGRADELGGRLRDATAVEVVCHGDPHLGNLLVGPGGEVWLIDWDDAVRAPRERDLMFVLGGVLAFAPVTAQQRASFLDGYGDVGPDPVRLAYYLCKRALEDLDWAARVLDVRRPVEERTAALEIVGGILSPEGIVPIALAAARRAAG